MKLKNVKTCAMILVLSTTFVLPPPQAMAQHRSSPVFPLDLFPDDDKSDTGLTPTSPTIPTTNPSNPRPNNSNNNSTKNNNNTTTRPQNNAAGSMDVAKVKETYSCPLFDNRPHQELIDSIDALNKVVKVIPECTGTPSAKSIEENGKAIKDNIATLQNIMMATDPALVSTGQIDTSITAAIAAFGNLGDIFNNNSFLNSKCGRETMTSGKVALALNDVVNGLAPYALFAVSMNAALTPALPFVIGGAIATSSISAISKMIDNNTLKMQNPEHRKAILQNTCQYTKVAKKVRFMQLAQSGKIEKITQELEKSVDLYNAKFANPSQELTALLKYKNSIDKNIRSMNEQLTNDQADLATIESQFEQNGDDMMVCVLAQELANAAQDGKAFPASAFVNLEAATAKATTAQKMQVTAMRRMHTNAVKGIAQIAPEAYKGGQVLKDCAQAGRSWLASVRQAVNTTSNVLASTKNAMETELNKNTEYRHWKTQADKIKLEKLTIKRVEKAMQELAKDNSIIDRSELAQRMVLLKSGLFGSSTSVSFGAPPVQAWINHTKSMHDQAVAGFVASMKQLREGALSLTPTGRARIVKYGYAETRQQIDNLKTAQALDSLNLQELPLGSREHELACQQLETTWLDWSAAIDHLGAIQFFCDMIDPVLDNKMDANLIMSCRGYTQLNGTTYRKSVVTDAKETLIKKGFQADAKLVGQRLKALQCPMPAVSVMNQ